MLPEVFRVRVVVLHPRGGERLVAVLPTDRVIDVIARALADAGIEPDAYGTWELSGPDGVLSPDRLIRELVPAVTEFTRFVLSLSPAVGPAGVTLGTAPGDAPPPRATPPGSPPLRGTPRDEFDDEEFGDGDAESDADEEEEADGARAEREAPAAPAKRKAKAQQRRATVRYYSRMNPDRVFPLLVMLTRQEVEEVVKRHVGQKATGPLKLDADTPLEIEPVLPGCAVYPPKVVTRLAAADQTFTFHVVPHVLGDVTGARVFVRQDHATLAEIALDVRVVQRTWVMVSGLSTVVLPAASAAMRHFGLDFTPKDGGNPYLALLDFLFGKVSPVVLTAALALVTGVAWWLTRPKGRDVFWDISTKPTGDGKEAMGRG